MQALPRHIAVIMDGNGRWAKSRYLPRTAGHKKGVDRVRDLVEISVEKGIEALTLFAFSQENWLRPEQEVSFLMSLLLTSLEKEIKALHRENIQVKVIGDRSQFSATLLRTIINAEALTANNTGLKFRLAINYGGQWDIVQAVNRWAETHPDPHARPLLTAADIDAHLETHDLPEVDLLIRTSGVARMSNFLLWQINYSEIYFTETLFPDFDRAAVEEALLWYQGIERRFGKITEQLKQLKQLKQFKEEEHA